MKKSLPIIFIILLLSGIGYFASPLLSIRLLSKFIAGLCFVGTGFLCYFYHRKQDNFSKSFAFSIILALLFCFFGDLVLTYINFVLGALLFAFGHLFYFISFCKITPFRRKDFLPIILLFLLSASLILFAPIFSFGATILKFLCVLYALFLSFMCGKSIGNFVYYKSPLTKILFLGSVLFFLSDLMLLLFCFAGAPLIADILCFVFYYPAQCLLGLSFTTVCGSMKANL